MRMHEDFPEIPEEDLEDIGIIADVPDIDPDPKHPLYDEITEYDDALYRRYCEAAGLSEPVRLTWPVILSVTGLALLFLKVTAGGIALLILGPVLVVMDLGLEKLRQKRRKKEAGVWWSGPWRIRLYTETVLRSESRKEKPKEKETAYDDIRHLYEDDQYLFLAETNRNVYVIDKNKTEDWLTEAVRMFMTADPSTMGQGEETKREKL